ncbi:MAG: hypothetical protein CSA49_06240 [Gammaproteobacteria bacterium]|nr:MAG: hypothetical protein CSA49_06240 [Gammaproteobacteria bacterium]
MNQQEMFVYDDQNRRITHTDFNGDYSVTQNDVMGRTQTGLYRSIRPPQLPWNVKLG